jgi:hypothetical protein
VYSLTEWAFDLEKFEFSESFGFFDHTEIYDNEECKLAFHDNKKTWERQTS